MNLVEKVYQDWPSMQKTKNCGINQGVRMTALILAMVVLPGCETLDALATFHREAFADSAAQGGASSILGAVAQGAAVAGGKNAEQYQVLAASQANKSASSDRQCSNIRRDTPSGSTQRCNCEKGSVSQSTFGQEKYVHINCNHKPPKLSWGCSYLDTGPQCGVR